MKYSMLKWLSCSLVLVFVFSCKKEKGVLDDFPSGRFEFVYVLLLNGNQDTIIGEVSGPYLQSMNYVFRVKQELLMDKSLKRFNVGNYKSIYNGHFDAQVNIGATISDEEHTSDNLIVYFQKGDTLSGSFTLTRKE